MYCNLRKSDASGDVDMSRAVITCPKSAARLPLFAKLLQSEVAKRSGVAWGICEATEDLSTADCSVVSLQVDPDHVDGDGYVIEALPWGPHLHVRVTGSSEHAVLPALYRLLRELRVRRQFGGVGQVCCSNSGLRIVSSQPTAFETFRSLAPKPRRSLVL